MSLDISLEDKDEEEIASINWTRNPFGLCNWAEANTKEAGLKSKKKDLYYVCNHWSYSKSHRINRQLFKDVVEVYWKIIKELKQGYFFFGLSSYIQFIQPNYRLFPKKQLFTGHEYIKDSKYSNDGSLAIPMEHFNYSCFHLGEDASLEKYQTWFQELVEFARLLQDRKYRFYCSN